MPHIIADCPNCGDTKREFEVSSTNCCNLHKHYKSIKEFETNNPSLEWGNKYELFTACKKCHYKIIFIIAEPFSHETCEYIKRSPPMEVEGLLNGIFEIEGIVRVCDNVACPAPDFIPQDIKAVFEESVKCLSMRCWNGAGAMFRTCLDIATKKMLPPKGTTGIKSSEKNYLAARIGWLFNNGKLPKDLKELAECIKDDGNVSVHVAGLTKEDAMETLRFTVMILEYVYTAPAQRKRAKQKRDTRKAKEAKLVPVTPELVQPKSKSVPVKIRVVASKPKSTSVEPKSASDETNPVPSKPKRRLIKPRSLPAKPISLRVRPNTPIVERIKPKIPLAKRISIRTKAKDVPPPE